MKKVFAISMMVVLASSVVVSAAIDLTDLSGYTYSTKYNCYVYNYDIPAGSGDITTISFDYSYGSASLPLGHAAFRIRRLNDDATDDWLGSFNIYSTEFNMDTDYGPSTASGSLAGTHHYEFTLNRYTGVWSMKLDDVAVALLSPAQDGLNYFSDESPEAMANALEILGAGWAAAAPAGLGGTGAYRLMFTEVPGGFVDNIQVTVIPEPATMGLLGLGALSLIRRKK